MEAVQCVDRCAGTAAAGREKGKPDTPQKRPFDQHTVRSRLPNWPTIILRFNNTQH